jgi:hypothetical protein
MRPSLKTRLVPIAAALCLAACKDGAGPDESVVSIEVTPKSSRVYNIGDQVTFSAVVTAQTGTDPKNVPITWSVRDNTLLQVTSTGHAVVLKRGGSTWVIATAGARSDSGFVDVPASTCGSTAVTTIAAGQVVTDITSSGLCVASGGADYALLIHSNSLVSAGISSYQVTAVGVDDPPAAVDRSPIFGSQFSLTTGSARVAPRRSFRVDLAMRRAEHAFTPAMVADAHAAFTRARTRATFAVAPPAVGSTIRVNVNTTDECVSAKFVDARVAAVSNRAIVLADPGNPTVGAYMDDEYAAFAARFDTLIHPMDSVTFGAPTDIDNNGRTILLFTKAVNERTPANVDYYIGGLTHPRDFKSTASCAGSNAGEIFYLLVPDSLGTVNGNMNFTKQFVNEVTEATIVHEYQHMINFGRRLAMVPPAPAEEIWLNEGLSHMAEELLYHRVTGIPPRTNIGRAVIVKDTLPWVKYFYGDFSLYDEYARTTNTASPFRGDDNLETRGATWAFLRYAADRASTSDGTLWFDLVNTSLTGTANLQHALGITSSTLLGQLRDFTISVYADDWIPGVATKYTQPSWNMRDSYNAFADPKPHYPLETGGTPLNDGEPLSINILTGGFQLLRFHTLSGTNTFIQIKGANGATLPPNTIITLIRKN